MSNFFGRLNFVCGNHKNGLRDIADKQIDVWKKIEIVSSAALVFDWGIKSQTMVMKTSMAIHASISKTRRKKRKGRDRNVRRLDQKAYLSGDWNQGSERVLDSSRADQRHFRRSRSEKKRIREYNRGTKEKEGAKRRG